jgi:hypothetical protein
MSRQQQGETELIDNAMYLKIIEDVLKSQFKGYFLYEKHSFIGTLVKSDINDFIQSSISNIDAEIHNLE